MLRVPLDLDLFDNEMLKELIVQSQHILEKRDSKRFPGTKIERDMDGCVVRVTAGRYIFVADKKSYRIVWFSTENRLGGCIECVDDLRELLSEDNFKTADFFEMLQEEVTPLFGQ